MGSILSRRNFSSTERIKSHNNNHKNYNLNFPKSKRKAARPRSSTVTSKRSTPASTKIEGRMNSNNSNENPPNHRLPEEQGRGQGSGVDEAAIDHHYHDLRDFKISSLKDPPTVTNATTNDVKNPKLNNDLNRAVQRPTRNNTTSSFPIWFPFQSGFQRNVLSDATAEAAMADADTALAGISSPEPLWLHSKSQKETFSGEKLQYVSSAISEPSEGPNQPNANNSSLFLHSFGEDEIPIAAKPTQTVTSTLSKEPTSKQNSMPLVKTSRRGRRVGNNAKDSQPYYRGIHKKQRAAHQALSPPSQASASYSETLRTREHSPPPVVRRICGKKVTMIDETLNVFVVDLLSPETCELVRSMTDAHVNANSNRMPTWRTLYTYTKQDLPCGEVKNLTNLVTDGIMKSISKIVGEIFHNQKQAAKLRPRSWKEPHLLLYQKIDGKPNHTGVEMHYDGCDLTWNCMLSKSHEYEGGGTYIRALQKTVRLEQGQVLVHPGELYHLGRDITNGVRALIVCFMDGFDPMIQDPSNSKEDRPEYQDNVRMY